MTDTWARRWQHKLDVSDVFHNDDLTLIEKRDAIVARIKVSRFYDADDYDLGEILDFLACVEDNDEFNGAWNEFYDWCDAGKRVWVDTGLFR